MANTLKKIFDPAVDEVVQNFTIQSWHVSQSVDAFTGTEAYDITLSGSLVVTGSVAINGLSATSQNGVVLYDDTTGLLYYTASSAFAVNNFYTSSVTQSITSSVVNNTINQSTINQTIISSSVNTPAPSDQYIQYNSGSTFGASANFQYVYSNDGLQQGSTTIASGDYSHAQGKDTLASGDISHAEGTNTKASGNGAHTEGYLTTASADFSHAEGYNTKATAPYSHAEGEQTTASGLYSHAEGSITLAFETGSHAEGRQTQATANFSHAEGGSTYAQGIYSHAEGFQSIARGIGSHAEGQATYANGTYSHTEGLTTTASANHSHAEGYGTIANGLYQHVQGQFNQLSSDQSAFIIGNGASAASRSNLVFAQGSSFQVTGSIDLTQNLTIGGGLRVNVTTGDPVGDYYLTATEHTFFASPTTFGGTVYLPSSPVAGMQYIIYRIGATHAFNVDGNGSTINGVSAIAFPTTLYTMKIFTYYGSGIWYMNA